MADVNDIYRGIISPQGGMYQPGPQVVMPGQSGLTSRPVETVRMDPVTNQPMDALAQLLIADARGQAGAGIGAGGRGNLNYAAPNQPAGSVVASKDQSRMAPNQFGYGENGVTGAEQAALAAIEQAAPQSKFAFTGSDPFDAYTRDYVASARPASLMARQPQQQGAGGGLFGIPMSPGMNRNIASRAGVAGIPGLPPRIQAQQVQKAAIAEALMAPSSTTITGIGGGGAWVDSNTGSVMPSATNTTRYHTLY